MTGKEAVKLARKEFQISWTEEYCSEWLCCVIKGLEQAENDLEVLEILKYLILSIERTFNQAQFNGRDGILGTLIVDYFINNDITGKVAKWLGREEE